MSIMYNSLTYVNVPCVHVLYSPSYLSIYCRSCSTWYRPVARPLAGGGAVMTKVGRTKKKKKKKKKRSSPLKIGTSEKNPFFPVVPPCYHLIFASPGGGEPKFLVIFVNSRRRRERKMGFLSNFLRRTLMYVSKWEFRGGSPLKKCENTPKI